MVKGEKWDGYPAAQGVGCLEADKTGLIYAVHAQHERPPFVTLSLIVESGHSRAIFVGPEIVYSFVDAIIKKNSLQLALTGSCLQWEELKQYQPESFDMILLFDANAEGIQKVTENTGIPAEKFIYLW